MINENHKKIINTLKRRGYEKEAPLREVRSVIAEICDYVDSGAVTRFIKGMATRGIISESMQTGFIKLNEVEEDAREN